MIATELMRIADFENLFKKVEVKDYGILGEIEIRYNPDKITEQTEIPPDTQIGFEHYGDSCLCITHKQKQLAEPLTFHLIEGEKELIVLATSWWMGSIGKAGFEHKESENHPFVLTWNRFLETQGSKYVSEEVINELTSGSCWPTHLNVSKTLKILNGWTDWLEKYVE